MTELERVRDLLTEARLRVQRCRLDLNAAQRHLDLVERRWKSAREDEADHQRRSP